MITLDLSILNQKGTPMFNSDLFANRPAAGIVGRIFISTDTQTIFRDTGTTWDTIGGGGGTIAGSIATGQVAFGTAANTIGGTNNLFWDNTNIRLGIETNTPQTALEIAQNAGRLRFNQTFVASVFHGIEYAFNGAVYASLMGNLNTGEIRLSTNPSYFPTFYASGAEAMRLSTARNLLIGTTTDAGQRLQVNGDTFLKGTGNTSATSALFIQNLSGANLYNFRNDAALQFGTQTVLISATGDGSNISTAGRGFLLQTAIGSASGVGEFSITGSINSISASTWTFRSSTNFIPASGTATYTGVLLQQIINQTGGANGITRGLHVNPTITAAADWRSIEWSNNTGWGLFGNGTAPNYFAGNVQIGSTTPIASDIKLQVTGRGQFNDTRTYTTGAAISFAIIKDLTINSAISGSTGIVNNVQAGTNIIGASLSVPSSTTFASLFTYNTYQFSSAGLTLTATQPGAGAGIRAVSQIVTQNVFNGANSGTISHVAGVQINGFYNNNTGTSTPIIQNAYQLLINDTGEFLHTFSFTNRWAIYQPGTNDRNYLAGNLLLNSTTDTGQILQVNGAIRVNGQASGTAGGSSGNHLIINLDGTQYKIALLNP